ncbi:MAG: helix-turn-helix transcriptional regulator [Ectothiorhodospiraceae bacterium]|nr:helix-turn-helix transcriptional regulator [Ectothiorhodospiraceae bacterium]MBN4053073.1 helix-turn-helix transcriptional regulator [Gammaproteobacteria bacterium AH-315-K14]
MLHNKIPSGNILSAKDIGCMVRDARKNQGATQAEFAALCGVGVRFISELENGKPTVQLGKVLNVIQTLGLVLAVTPRGWQNERMDD